MILIYYSITVAGTEPLTGQLNRKSVKLLILQHIWTSWPVFMSLVHKVGDSNLIVSTCRPVKLLVYKNQSVTGAWQMGASCLIWPSVRFLIAFASVAHHHPLATLSIFPNIRRMRALACREFVIRQVYLLTTARLTLFQLPPCRHQHLVHLAVRIPGAVVCNPIEAALTVSCAVEL